MKLFISYARDNKHWVYEFCRVLREETQHGVWIDERIVPAEDWWETILVNIETCDCFVFVMTPQAVGSIYCQAELDYALALNKPVLPLMVENCELPNELFQRHIHYQEVPPRARHDWNWILFKVAQSLHEVQLSLMKGKYQPQPTSVYRPELPQPSHNHPEHLYEVFACAEEAAESNLTLALRLFQQVVDADPEGLGVAAQERMDELHFERDRETAYQNVLRLAAQPNLRKGAQAAWRSFVRQYGDDYDPQHIAARLADNADSRRSTSPNRVRVTSTGTLIIPAAEELLPQPFEWVHIPQGYTPDDSGQEWLELGAFYISKYPITVGQYALFVQDGGYQRPFFWTAPGWEWRERENIHFPERSTERATRYYKANHYFYKSNHPMIGVSWHEALAFCHWLSSETAEDIHLPTRLQWQRAAIGDQDQPYPWGQENHTDYCNSQSRCTSPVTQYPQGASLFGVMDMCGNVWEWTVTDYDSGEEHQLDSPGRRVLKGGSWFDSKPANATFNLSFAPHIRSNYVGFRVVRWG